MKPEENKNPARENEEQPSFEDVIGRNVDEDILEEIMYGISEPDEEEIQQEIDENASQKIRMWQQRDKSYKMMEVLKIWKEVQIHDRNLKSGVSRIIFFLLIGEMAVAALGFFMMGLGLLKFEAWVGEIFIVGVISQIFGIATIVVHSLFPKPQSDTLTELNKIVDKL